MTDKYQRRRERREAFDREQEERIRAENAAREERRERMAEVAKVIDEHAQALIEHRCHYTGDAPQRVVNARNALIDKLNEVLP